MLHGYIAEYMRISDDDDDLSEYKNESDSISNQRNVMDDYIGQHEDLKKHPVKEFCDDGYSGVNFKRPGFQKLLKEVRENKIYCIIIKDFSRMGRNYIEVGDYLEQIFPFFGVRVISISDHYDSDVSTGGIDVGFQTLIHDLYSKDLSKKIKCVKRLHQEKGAFTGGNIPFGFKIGMEEKSNYVIDADAAEIVRMIFALACQGKSTGVIAKELNESNVPTRGRYMAEHNATNYAMRNEKNNFWTSGQVKEILENEEYIGTRVAHKLTSPRLREVARTRSEEYIKHENAHILIISKEQFAEANKVIRSKGTRGKYMKREDDSVLKGKVKCGCCGYSMNCISRVKKPYFICRMGANCDAHTRVDVETLEGVVLKDLNQMKLIYIQRQEDNAKIRTKKLSSLSKMKEERRMLQLHVERCKSEKLLSYKQYKDGGTIEKYREKQNKLDQEQKQYARQLEKLETTMEELSKDKTSDASEIAVLRDSEQILELNRELVQELIDHIEVFDYNRLEIYWKFNVSQ
jgi:site-specific DNA recombinase